MKRAVIDLGNTLVSYYPRDQWPDILAAGISQVAEGLRARGLLRVAPQELPARVAAERGSGTDHRVRPLAGRLARVFGLTVEAKKALEKKATPPAPKQRPTEPTPAIKPVG